MKKDWKQFIVNVGGVDFRPVSMGSLSMLYSIGSPLVVGGELDATDFCVFAWLHGAPLMEVLTAVKAGNWFKKAILWGAELEPTVFASFSVPTMKALAKDLSMAFVDPNSGFIPFPRPSHQKPSWVKRVWTFIIRPFSRG